MDKPNYYAIIPANVRYDNNITANAKLLYGEITALSNKEGVCWASNNYFATLYECTPQAISKLIKLLKERGYINIDYIYKEDSKEIEKRIISLVSTKDYEVSTNDYGGINKSLGGYQQMIKDNNTSINNTSINNNSRFTPPTFEEVNSYCIERGNNVDPQTFIDFYESKGWKVGNQKMKDWKACVRTWEKRGNYRPNYKYKEPIIPHYDPNDIPKLTEEEKREIREKQKNLFVDLEKTKQEELERDKQAHPWRYD